MSTPLVPFEEVLMSPNREQAERLFCLVKRQWVLTRDAWPMWARLVQKFGWAVVIKAADRCHPEKRYVNSVEAMCMEVANEAPALQSGQDRLGTPTAEERKARGAAFAEARRKAGV